jgi:hypothetical protein
LLPGGCAGESLLEGRVVVSLIVVVNCLDMLRGR